jgi:hypothetical protein
MAASFRFAFFICIDTTPNNYKLRTELEISGAAIFRTSEVRRPLLKHSSKMLSSFTKLAGAKFERLSQFVDEDNMRRQNRGLSTALGGQRGDAALSEWPFNRATGGFQRLMLLPTPEFKTAPDFSPVAPVVPRLRWTRPRRNGAVIGALSDVRHRSNSPPMSALGQKWK